MARIVTKAMLVSGEISEITAREYAALRGCSTHTLDKERCDGKSISFIKRRNRCWYLAADVLEALEPEEIYTNTSQYAKPIHLANLERNKKGRYKKKPAA